MGSEAKEAQFVLGALRGVVIGFCCKNAIRRFVLALEIKLDLDVVRIAQKNLPTGAIWHLVNVLRDSLLGKMPLRRLKAAAAKSDMIDDA